MTNLSLEQEAGLRRGPGRLADGAHGPVLQLSESKTVDCHMQVCVGQAGVSRETLFEPGWYAIPIVKTNLSRFRIFQGKDRNSLHYDF